MNMDLEKWKKWIKEIYKNFKELYINRYVFWEVQEIIKNNAVLENFIPMYCHRKFGPLSKTRLWYNINLLERSIRWQNENVEPSPRV